jgi:hypothetical protein
LTEAIAKKFSMSAVFVWQPAPIYNYNQQYNIFAGYNYDGLTPYLKSGYEYMAKRTRDAPPAENFIWCADIQQDMKEAVYADAYHYSGPMNKTIALYIFKAMVERNLLSTTWSQREK